MSDFSTFLEYIRTGMSEEDAAALCDVMSDELDAWLDAVPDSRRAVAKAQAEFRLRMTRVLVDTAEINRSVQAARHFLQRPARSKQLELDFAAAGRAVLEMPTNGRD